MAAGAANATYDTGTAAATTATTVTLPTSGAPGGTGVWNGRIISLANRWGVVPQQHQRQPARSHHRRLAYPLNPSSIASTPAAGVYNILPGQAPIMYLALTADATAPAAGDTALATELAANGFTRAFFTTYSPYRRHGRGGRRQHLHLYRWIDHDQQRRRLHRCQRCVRW
jgi:hypothetical protein